MGRVESPTWARLWTTRFRWITFSFFVGFGLPACTGGDGADEPVAQDSAAPADGEQAAAGGEATAQEGKEAPEANADEEALEGAVADEEPSDTAPPADVVDSSSDSVKAELDADADPKDADTGLAQAEPAAEPAPAAVAEPTPSTSLVDSSSGAGLAPGEYSSPGAAKNLPSGTYSSKKKSKSYEGAVAPTSVTANGDEAIYVVRSGDTLARIAALIYGNAKQWHSMAALNGLGAPYKIFPGDELKFELSNGKAKSFAASIEKSKKFVTVKKGDTLATIAEKIFGNQSEWKMFLAYNKEKISNPNRISSGMKLAYVNVGGEAPAISSSKKSKSAPTKKSLTTDVVKVKKAKEEEEAKEDEVTESEPATPKVAKMEKKTETPAETEEEVAVPADDAPAAETKPVSAEPESATEDAPAADDVESSPASQEEPTE